MFGEYDVYQDSPLYFYDYERKVTDKSVVVDY